MGKSLPMTFCHHEFGKLRVIVDGEYNIWFSGEDIASTLGYKNIDKVLETLDPEDKCIGLIIGKEVLLINSFGLHSLFPGAPGENVKQYKEWLLGVVCSTVAKSITHDVIDKLIDTNLETVIELAQKLSTEPAINFEKS